MREAIGTSPAGESRRSHSRSGIRVGPRFLFLDRERAEPAWMKQVIEAHPELAASPRQRCTIPLPSEATLVIGSQRFQAAVDPCVSLRCVTVDRDLYRHRTDIVHVLVVDLDRPGQLVPILIRSTNSALEAQMVQLDENGLGLARVGDLPIGQYEISFTDGGYQGPVCSFRVAGFELAPLVATLTHQQLSGRKLSVKLNLQRFDKPFTGTVRIDLLDEGERVDCRLAEARDGIAFAAVELVGEGPHSLEIHVRNEADATATIPLQGSRREERVATTLSRCGPTYVASMMPYTGSQCVRGLHIVQMGKQSAPIWLTGIGQRKVKLEVQKQVEDCCVVVRRFEPPQNHDEEKTELTHRVHRLGDLAAGDIVEIEAPSPAGVISLGGFVDGMSWEATAVAISPGELSTQIKLQQSDALIDSTSAIQAGKSLTLRVQADAAIDGSVAVLVKDARLASSQRPEQELANQLKTASEDSHPGPVWIDDISTRFFESSISYVRPMHYPPLSDEVLQQLRNQGTLSSQQIADLQDMQLKPDDLWLAITLRGYADATTLARAVAEVHHWEYVDFDEFNLPSEIALQCPESVARENLVFPIAETDGELTFVMADPFDLETIDKLRFILNRRIRCAISTVEQIAEAINENYGQVAYEYAETMLQEFTDTAIDFTDTANLLADSMPIDREEPSPSANIHEPSYTLLCDIIPLKEGVAEIEVLLPDEPGHYTVETFAVSQLDWQQQTLHFESTAEPYVKLQLPEVIFRDDSAMGRFVARTSSPFMSVRLLHEGKPVLLRDTSNHYQPLENEYLEANEVELAFEVMPGTYQAEVIDRVTGRVASVTKQVSLLGEFTERCRVSQLLMPGEAVEVNDVIGRIRLALNPKRTRFRVAQATANYEHLCCEQTAAKLFAALVCLSLAEPGSPACTAALQSAQAGVRRLRSMWSRVKGFYAYPNGMIFPELGVMAAEHLMKKQFINGCLNEVPEVTPILAEIDELLAGAMQFYRIKVEDGPLRNCWDAYVMLRSPHCTNIDRIVEFARRKINVRRLRLSVYHRAELAYAAACLLRVGNAEDVATALPVANQLFEQVEASGMLYSTVDSTGLLILMQELSHRGLYQSDSSLIVNGQTQTVVDVLASDQPIQSLVAGTDPVSVELIRWRYTHWASSNATVPMKVTLQHLRRHRHHFHEGESITLNIMLPDGYRVGDLLWIALPPCLSRLEGGGQVKQFTLDLEGQPSVSIRLAATSLSATPWQASKPQHFLVCLRNMYDEDRIGNLGPIPVHVEPRNTNRLTTNE